MEIRNWQEITIESECFDRIRKDFDGLLQRLLQKMQQNESEEGNITLKLDIRIDTDYIPNEFGTADKINKPILKHSISTAVPVKEKFDGTYNTGMKLVYDEELKRFVLRYVAEGGQQSIFDPEYANIINGTAEEVTDDNPSIPERALIGCNDETENADSEAIDAEVREIQDEEEWNCPDGDTEATDDYDYEEE